MRSQQSQDIEENDSTYRYWGPPQWPVLQKERPVPKFASASKSKESISSGKKLKSQESPKIIHSKARGSYIPQTVPASDSFKEVFGSEYIFFGQDYTPIPWQLSEASKNIPEPAPEPTLEPALEFAPDAACDAVAEASGEFSRGVASEIAPTNGGRLWRRMLEAISIFWLRDPNYSKGRSAF